MSTIILNLSQKKKSNKMQIHSPIIPRFTTREFSTRFYRRRESLNHPRIKLYTFPLDEKMQFVVRREIIQGEVVTRPSLPEKPGVSVWALILAGKKTKIKRRGLNSSANRGGGEFRRGGRSRSRRYSWHKFGQLDFKISTYRQFEL